MLNFMPIEIICITISYIAGSINFPIIVLKIFGKQDPRYYGSKNPGVTNVYRQSGAKLAAIALLFDISRAALVGLLAIHLIPSSQHVPLACLGLIIGNRFPCFHAFSGGKGVANYLGFYIPISPLSSLISIAIWCATFLVFRVPFIASFAMISVLSIGSIQVLGNNHLAILEIIFTTAIIFSFHTNNILQFIKKTN